MIGNACTLVYCFMPGQIVVNGACVCQTLGAFVDAGICTCGVHGLNISNICSCPTNSVLVNNECTCNMIVGQIMQSGSCICPITGQIVESGVCKCPSGFEIVNGACKEGNIHVINSTDISMICSQQISVSSFEVSSITDSVSSSNFASGYVFSSTLTNAFIDIQNNVYSNAVLPLFANQIQFIRIKIQVGVQNSNAGSFLSNSNSIYINQLNIMSKLGTQLNIISGQMSILLSTSNNANISSLMINLSISSPNGDISLINNINSVLNIQTYSIQGNYYSQCTVAMIGLNINSASISINLLNFLPYTYNVGNYSSYLISYILQSTIILTNISIVSGNKSVQSILISISSSFSNKFQFGGLIQQLTNTSVTLTNLIQDCHQYYNTKAITRSGILIGQALDYNSLFITNLCQYQFIFTTSENGQITQFGLIGLFEGNVDIKQSFLTFNITSSTLDTFGIIGWLLQYKSNNYANIQNMRTTINTFTYSSGFSLAVIVGMINSNQCQVINTVVNNSNITSAGQSAGIFGLTNGNLSIQTQITIQNVIIGNSIFISSDFFGLAAGFIAQPSGSNISITNSAIQNIQVLGNAVAFFIIDSQNMNNIFSVSSCQTIGNNYMNAVIQSNCGTVTNLIIPKGC
ncbi:Hypothetical_protein [Hexamita inflata]|uniref:Hypothetical_protein n=2 Tax=Hexamita inflata TaxID=28002 RepID=A0AA86QD54_9EUKA|nr:Hypothetical protein HINF_LOCUS44210 [Hexamita inflata]